MEKVVSLCLCAVLLLEGAVAVDSMGGPSSQGTEFILGFLEHEKDVAEPEDKVALIITTLSDTPATVTVSAPLFNESWTENVNVSRDGAAIVTVPSDIRGSGVEKSTKGIWVQSTEKVSVVGVSMESRSTGAFLCLPVNVLGQEYYAVTYINKAALMVVATQNDTQVSIVWPDDAGPFNFEGATYGSESTLNVTLDEFETLHISPASKIRDFTGAYVTSDKPIAVLSGNRKVTVPFASGTSDHLEAMLIPVNSWGKEFITISTPDRSIGDVYRIVASEDNTTIRFSDNTTLEISEAGDFQEIDLPTGSYQKMTSDKPIMVAVFSKEFDKDQDDPNKGDPSMSLLIPETQYASGYAWSTFTNPTGEDFNNKVSVIIERRKMSGLQLNGSSVQWQHQQAVIGSNKIHLWGYLDPGFYELLHSDPSVTFMTMASGTAPLNAYLFPAGMRLCMPSATVAGDLVDNDCDGRVDEELWNNVDDDDDGKIDEDISKPQASPPTHNCTDLDYIPENGTVTCGCSVEYLGDPPGNLTWLLGDIAIDMGESGVTELLLPPQYLTREYDFTQLICQVTGNSRGCAMLPLHIAYGPDKVELVEYQHYDVSTNASLTTFHCKVTGMNPVCPDMVQWQGPCGPDGFMCTVDPALRGPQGETVMCRVTNDKNANHFAEDVKPITKDDDVTKLPEGRVGFWPVLGTLVATNLATLMCSITYCCCYNKSKKKKVPTATLR